MVVSSVALQDAVAHEPAHFLSLNSNSILSPNSNSVSACQNGDASM